MSKIPFTVIYLLLLLSVALGSWVCSVYALSSADGVAVVNMLDAVGVRWMVRHSMEYIAGAPFVEVVLVLLMIGAVKQCGLGECFPLWGDKRRMSALSKRQSYALYGALGIAVSLFAVVLLGVLPPGRNLLSVTGHFSGSPLAAGWLFLLCMLVCIPCLCYGWLSDMWRSERDVLRALSSEVSRCSGYFVTLVVAAILMAALQYTQLLNMVGWADGSSVIAAVLYGLPFLASLMGEK